MARKLESFFIEGPAGRIESLLEGPDADARIERAAVFLHPHPLYGGTMHNKVVFRLAKAGRRANAAVLRINFRGVGTSDGTYDEGQGEQDDARAAISYMRERHPGLPLVVGGFSFGARTALKVSCGDPGVERVLALGTPVSKMRVEPLSQCSCPKHFIHSTNDEFGSVDAIENAVLVAAEPKSLRLIEAEDHFFNGALDALEDAIYEAIVAPAAG